MILEKKEPRDLECLLGPKGRPWSERAPSYPAAWIHGTACRGTLELAPGPSPRRLAIGCWILDVWSGRQEPGSEWPLAREAQDCLSRRWVSSVLATNRGRLGAPSVALSWMKDQPLRYCISKEQVPLERLSLVRHAMAVEMVQAVPWFVVRASIVAVVTNQAGGSWVPVGRLKWRYGVMKSLARNDDCPLLCSTEHKARERERERERDRSRQAVGVKMARCRALWEEHERA